MPHLDTQSYHLIGSQSQSVLWQAFYPKSYPFVLGDFAAFLSAQSKNEPALLAERTVIPALLTLPNWSDTFLPIRRISRRPFPAACAPTVLGEKDFFLFRRVFVCKPYILVDKELIINATESGVELALIENGKLAELHHQKTNNNFTVGDIFIGKIRKMMPGLNAAFVDIGHRKDAFLHYTDLGPKLRSLIKWSNGVINGSINTSQTR
jgi:hypothetical protein